MVVLGNAGFHRTGSRNHSWRGHSTDAKAVLDDRVETRLAVSVEEAAGLLSVSPHTVRRAIRQGLIPSVRINRRVVVPLAQLQRLLTAETDAQRGGFAGSGGIIDSKQRVF